MKKKILLLLFIIFLTVGCGKVPQLANGEEAIVSFDNEKLAISADDLFNALKDRFALNILIDMIDWKILLEEYPDEADEAKKFAENRLAEFRSQFDDEEAFMNQLNQSGFATIEEVEETLKLNFYRNLAIEDYAKKQITDRQIEDHYKNETVGDIRASHILIGINAAQDATEAEKAEAEAAALRKAQNIIKELNNGANFAELAKEHSTDTGSAVDGGDLDFFNKGVMVPQFDKAAFALKVNEYTKTPIKTQFGFHIILKTDEKEKPTLEEAKEDIIEVLSQELLDKDNTLAIHALVDLRKAYGFNIEDSNLKSQYSTFISNQILNAQNLQN